MSLLCRLYFHLTSLSGDLAILWARAASSCASFVFFWRSISASWSLRFWYCYFRNSDLLPSYIFAPWAITPSSFSLGETTPPNLLARSVARYIVTCLGLGDSLPLLGLSNGSIPVFSFKSCVIRKGPLVLSYSFDSFNTLGISLISVCCSSRLVFALSLIILLASTYIMFDFIDSSS